MVLCTRPPKVGLVDSCAYPGHGDPASKNPAGACRQRQLSYPHCKTTKRFSTIPTDQAHEQNNQLMKGSGGGAGGAAGLTENPSAFKKWIIAGLKQARLLTVWGAVPWYLGRRKSAPSWRGCINPEDISRASRWPCPGHRWNGQPIPRWPPWPSCTWHKECRRQFCDQHSPHSGGSRQSTIWQRSNVSDNQPHEVYPVANQDEFLAYVQISITKDKR